MRRARTSRSWALPTTTRSPRGRARGSDRARSGAPRTTGARPYAWSIQQDVEPFNEVTVVDAGDAPIVPGRGARSLRVIHEKVHRVASAGVLPIVLGGDHSITYPSAAAVARVQHPRSIGIVHFDAHADAGEEQWGSLIGHGEPMRRLVEEGWVAGRNFVQVGLRGYWPDQDTFGWMREQGFRWHTMVELEERGADAVIADAIAEALDGPDAIYLSVDIDVVDPGMAPGTGTPESGGMLARELLRAIRQIVRDVDLVGMDVVEVSPPYDQGEVTALARAPVRAGGDLVARRPRPRHRRRPRPRRRRRPGPRTRPMTSGVEGHEHELADNRKLWDAYTAIHTTGSFYDVQRFRDDPHDHRIRPFERDEVGDVEGKTLLHVQCHFGLDTLSWARLGATVTGVDFSEPAIAFARELAAETGLGDRSRFVVSNVYDLPGPLVGETFDVVYTSRGALCWLPDIPTWARIVAGFVKPGGIFYVHEAHPVFWAVADEQERPNDLHFGFDYWGGETITFPVQGSYADPDADVDAEVEHGWNHSLGEIVTALADAGLRIELLDEKRVLDWPVPFLRELQDGSYGFPEDQVGTIPLMYSLRARKDG